VSYSRLCYVDKHNKVAAYTIRIGYEPLFTDLWLENLLSGPEYQTYKEAEEEAKNWLNAILKLGYTSCDASIYFTPPSIYSVVQIVTPSASPHQIASWVARPVIDQGPIVSDPYKIKNGLKSCICTQSQTESADFRHWIEELKLQFKMHRKQWELGYILQSLAERGQLEPGRKGLGFAVGKEPLPSLMAKYGCDIVATDLPSNDPRAVPWAETDQHALRLEGLHCKEICDIATFGKRVTYRDVDMLAIPPYLRNFDFCWSTCAFEHLGSISLGLRFLEDMLVCLKPGGVAVHTTEFNLTSDLSTIDNEWTVIYRKRDIVKIVRHLRTLGYHVADLDFTVGEGIADWIVDPFEGKTGPHLRVKYRGFAVTCIGLIITKPLDWSE
jgi:hypothetical protein